MTRCVLCGRDDFPTPEAMIAHQKESHPKPPQIRYRCPALVGSKLCGFVAEYDRSILVHLVRDHLKLEELRCNMCGEQEVSIPELRYHICGFHGVGTVCPIRTCIWARLDGTTEDLIEHLVLAHVKARTEEWEVRESESGSGSESESDWYERAMGLGSGSGGDGGSESEEEEDEEEEEEG